MANQITIIRPYKWYGQWVFDDPTVGLEKEPFVGGSDVLIDAAVVRHNIHDADNGFLLLFSAEPFPGAEIELNWVREEMGGNVYEWEGREGWLCPALLRYFPQAPERIHAQIKNRRDI